ncbi:SAM hydrolase/SAM-dependent halogenase family protein [Halorubrum vacuolatum]|uniref:S-adenosyl-l-methionine hydroxide adenosyltransferase n=1 Tax=Halorubrum vacuolatum TaxID=63740 RepID=A0A238W2Y7_HALVU|nr:SAM-dependent chlorinase/fluorinase [Halorubrum vacuolatum]SNR40704.1 hypothetical protein SAMN06264855_10557 [Halorubrum vacuolatum]
MITLATDFGSPYPAAMKGVIRRESAAELIDVAHNLPRGDPRAAAFWLRFVLPEFPPAVHCAVVDPGVGTDRAAIVVRAGRHAIVAPDNGLAVPPARALAAATGSGPDDLVVFEIDVDDPESATFHGRDVFAPAAAAVRENAWGDDGIDDDALASLRLLSPAARYVDRTLPEPTVERDAAGVPTSIEGEVLAVDDFGNVITNVPGKTIDGIDRLRVNGHASVPVARTFDEVPPGDPLVTVGSHGFVECDVNDGRGAEAFGLAPEERVRLVPA